MEHMQVIFVQMISFRVLMGGSVYRLAWNVMEGTLTARMDRMSLQVCAVNVAVQIHSCGNGSKKIQRLPVLMEGIASQLQWNVMEKLTAMMDRMNWKRIVGIVQIHSLPVLMKGSAYQLDGNVMGSVNAQMDRMNWKRIVGIVQIHNLPVLMEGSAYQLDGNVMGLPTVTMDRTN